MKLYIEDNVDEPAVLYQVDDPGSGWTETTDPIQWDHYYNGIQQINREPALFRNDLIDNFVASWSGYSDDQKKALIRNFVWDSSATQEELDALYPCAERREYVSVFAKKLYSCEYFLKLSLDTDSDIVHEIEINDSGQIFITKLDPDETL